jgi:hypothetical protein
VINVRFVRTFFLPNYGLFGTCRNLLINLYRITPYLILKFAPCEK